MRRSASNLRYIPMGSVNLSPLISRLRAKLLAVFFPPKGKPSLHCAITANVAYMADMSNISLSCGLPLRFALVALSCSAKGILQKGFPLGWKLSRKRLMRGDKSALAKGIHSPTRPAHRSCAKPYSAKPRTSQSAQKLPCTATAAQRTRIISTHQPGGCRAGKFGVGQGGLEGRETPPKGVSSPSKVFLHSTRSTSSPPNVER